MLTLKDFDFNLPSELIAQQPILSKEKVKLLEINNNYFKDYTIFDLESLINKNDLLVVNNTKVIKSRICAKYNNVNLILTLHKVLSNGNWLAFTKKSSKLHSGTSLILEDNNTFDIVNNLNNGEIEIRYNGSIPIDIYLEKFGFMPLPPYIKRKNINNIEDITNYQSIFAKNKGAVAAPTASLHFTKKLLNTLIEKGVKFAEVTLHVGAGTFLPVKTTNIHEHKMHAEYGEISLECANLIKQTKQIGGKIIAIGTTTLRILEHVASLYGTILPYQGLTQIFIYPGYKFKVVDNLITNFHTPRSTLLMLVSAFAGINSIKKAYKHAISNNYRFFSYGDCTFLHKEI